MGKKKKKQPELQAQAQPKAQEPARPSAQPKVEFDVWWALRGKKLPQQHHKEILKADFAGRGLSMNESMAAYDRALEQYGVKLS